MIYNKAEIIANMNNGQFQKAKEKAFLFPVINFVCYFNIFFTGPGPVWFSLPPFHVRFNLCSSYVA